MATSNMKLVYFDQKGRCEMIRVMFAEAGVPYDNSTFEMSKWGEVKKTTPFGQVPYLEVDGKQYTQSIAIANYVAKELGYYGKNNLEQLRIDQVVQIVQDVFNLAVKYLFGTPDKEEKAIKLEEYKATESRKFLEFLEELLKSSGTGFFAGSQLSLADFVVFDLATGMMADKICPLENFPQVQGLVDRMKNSKNMKAYLDSRPESQF